MTISADVSWRATNAGTQALRLLQGAGAGSGTIGGAPAAVADSISLSARAQSLLAALLEADPADGAAAQALGVFAATDDAGTGWMVASAGDASAGISILSATPEEVAATAGAAADPAAHASIVTGAGDARIRAYAVVAGRQDARLGISSGDGADSIAGVTTGALAIEAGGGDNQVAARFGTFGDIATGGGRNSIALAGNLGSVTTGDGDTAVAAAGIGIIATTGAGQDSIEGAQWVRAGLGDDSITLGNADLSSIAWRAGDGSDTITLAAAGDGVRATASRAVIGDGSGAFEAAAIGIAPQEGLHIAVPQAEEAGAGTAHAALYLQGVSEADVSASLSGTDLTLSLATTGETLTIRNYDAGRVTFLFDTRDAGGGLSATRTLAGLG
ncbi:hypothetical protein ACFQY5_27615 [Paeniroseomonas aquatica]|uniref:Calcium-binding protein n=1 Tax=Paeniroseomonas aquatica TaxID=373043 RepID=A0ABT8A8M8_9PROT|nr:hypothetical protein [Paeniroseomonas aquatica]MDN3566162.1 hypothetical protein [Paeniroseomonas aquatica]